MADAQTHDFTLMTSEFDPFRGGIGTVSRELSFAATRLGVNVRLVAPDYLGTEWIKVDAALPFPVERFKAGPYKGRQMPKLLRVALSKARQAQGARLIALDFPFLEALAFTAPVHRTPFDAILHGSEVRRAAKFPRKLLARRIFDTPERLIANSQFTRSALLDTHNVDQGKVTVAPLGVAQDWFADAKGNKIRNKLNLGDKRIIVCTGRINSRKGQVDLLRALNQTPDPETLAVVIAGRAMPADAGYLAQIETEATKCAPITVIIRSDLEDNDLHALYAEADLFCLPGSAKTTAIEGFGLVFLEAAAQGLPAVAGDVGGVSEAVINNTSGLLVPPDNVDALRAALTRCLGDTDLRQRLSKGAKEHAKASSWERFAQLALGLNRE